MPIGNRRRALGLVLLCLGAALCAGVVVMGKLWMPEFQGPRPLSVEVLRGTAAWLRLSLFGYSFPAGVGLVLLGAGLLGDATGGRAALLGLAGALGVATMSLVPRLFGASVSPGYFGIGGGAILALFVAAACYWARQRRELSSVARRATDLQAVGYLCFALAAWNACGSGGMPGWAAYPERVIAAGTRMLAVGQLKAVMAFFVLGWLFTVLGLRAARRAREEAPQARRARERSDRRHCAQADR